MQESQNNNFFQKCLSPKEVNDLLLEHLATTDEVPVDIALKYKIKSVNKYFMVVHYYYANYEGEWSADEHVVGDVPEQTYESKTVYVNENGQENDFKYGNYTHPTTKLVPKTNYHKEVFSQRTIGDNVEGNICVPIWENTSNDGLFSLLEKDIPKEYTASEIINNNGYSVKFLKDELPDDEVINSYLVPSALEEIEKVTASRTHTMPTVSRENLVNGVKNLKREYSNRKYCVNDCTIKDVKTAYYPVYYIEYSYDGGDFSALFAFSKFYHRAIPTDIDIVSAKKNAEEEKEKFYKEHRFIVPILLIVFVVLIGWPISLIEESHIFGLILLIPFIYSIIKIKLTIDARKAFDQKHEAKASQISNHNMDIRKKTISIMQDPNLSDEEKKEAINKILS